MDSRQVLVPLACALFATGCLDDGLVNSDSTGALPQDEPRQNVVVAAVGLENQPALLQFSVPAATAFDITAARLRWVGRGTNPAGDPTLLVNGHQRAGTLVASMNVGGDAPWMFVYEYDATTLVRTGTNRLFVGGFELGGPMRADGAAIAISYNDPSSPWTSVQFVEPNEFVSSGAGQVWDFAIGYSPAARNARFVVVAGDCEPAGTDRIWWSAGPGDAPASLLDTANVLTDRLSASSGNWMDVLTEDLAIPGGAAHFAYQLESPAEPAGDDIMHLLGVICLDGEPLDCAASVSGRVWSDEDLDGTEDAGEPGLAGVTVNLWSGDEVIATAGTDPTGAFALTELCAGEYVLAVDEATLPEGVVATTCDTGPCSPYEIVLAAADSQVTGLAFGWGSPPPEEACFYLPDYWEFQYTTLVQGGRCEPLPADLLLALLEIVEVTTARDWSQGDGTLDPEDAVALLKNCSPDDCGQAERVYLACLLNFAFNEAHRGLPVDTDGDGEVDSTMGVVIETIEPLLAAGEAAGCADARDLAAAVNETPSAGSCVY